MAYKEVDPGPAPEMGEFVKFNAIGDRFAGVFVGIHERTANFTEGPRQVKDYNFKTKQGLFTVSPSWDLQRRLDKAELKPGYKVIIEFTSTLPPRKAGNSPQKIFKVLVDDEVKASAPPPPPPPAGDDLDDIPF